MKARHRLAALFGRPGIARTRTAASAATPAASRDSKGSGAPSAGRSRLALATFAATFASLVVGVSLAFASAPSVYTALAVAPDPTAVRFFVRFNPEGKETHYHIEYLTNEKYVTEGNTFNGADQTGAGVATGSGENEAVGLVENLIPHTVYRARFVASNEDGTTNAALLDWQTHEETFETPEEEDPTVAQTKVTGVSTTEATLNAKINPRGLQPTYQFRYVDLASYEAEGFNNAASTPAEPLTGTLRFNSTLGRFKIATESLSGLQPDTAYRYRVLATNQKGTTEGPVEGFHTFAFPSEIETCPNAVRRLEQHSTFLPDCRAYEQVSPVDKNGGDILAFPGRTRVSPDGEAITFSSAAGFADVRGSGAAFEYMAQREPNGWITHGLDPAIVTESVKTQLAGDNFFKGPFSPDLSRGIFQSSRPPIPVPTVEETPPTVSGAVNLYVRDDLTTPGPGHWRLATPCPACYVARLAIGATGGEFTLTFKGHDTASLPYNASAAEIQAALEALPNVGSEHVRVSAPSNQPEGTHDILFAGSLSANTQKEAEELAAALSVNQGSLSGGGATVSLGEEPVSMPSVNPTATEPYVPWVVGASSDFSHIYFESLEDLTAEPKPQSPLCGKDTPGFAIPGEIFCSTRLYEWEDGKIRLAGILPSGAPVDLAVGGTGAHLQHYTIHAASDGSDGHNRIILTQPTNSSGQSASEGGFFNLAILNLNGSSGNLFMREDHSRTIKLNESERTGATETHGGATYLDATPNGEHVFFLANGLTNDAPENNNGQLYMYSTTPDAEGHHLKLISAPEESVGGVIGTSQNGEYVYYTDEGGIVLWHNGETKRFGPGLGEATPSLASFFGGHQIQARVTPDGQYLVYAHEVHGECGWSGEFDCQEIYVYSAATNTVSCASCQQSGETPSFDAGTAVTGFHGPTEPNGVLAPVFPGNGKYVFFSTEQSLLPRDTNGVSDVYEYNTETGELSLLSSGTSKRGSWLLGTGEDGRDVFIDTEQQLVGWDNDSAYDVYDVRIGGGLPEPPAVHAPCTGEVCQGAATPAPSSAPLSSNLESAGNVKVHRHPCPPGTHAVKSHGKTRCAKSKHRKSHRHGKAHRRAARAYRRASK